MARTEDAISLETVLSLARQLSAVDKVRLIERIAPDIEKDLVPTGASTTRSLLGILKDLGPAPSDEEIAEARREAWSGFERNDL